MTTGDVRTVFGVGGTTEANGTWTITVIDATHIDLQGTTFTNVYTSGGSVNGRWDGTNTNNWVTTSGGTNYGQTVPGSGDTVTLDGASGGGIVTVNTTVTIQTLTCGAHTGTLDFSANNNNVTLSGANGFNGSGTGTRTLNLGNGTWTLTGNSTVWNFGVITGLTFNANASTIIINNTTATLKTFLGGGFTYNIVSIAAGVIANAGHIAFSGANTIATLLVAAPNLLQFANATTHTITNAVAFIGTSGNEIGIISNSVGTQATISTPSGAATFDWCSIRDIIFTGGATFTATNSFDLGHNTGVTISPPSGGGVTGVIGG